MNNSKDDEIFRVAVPVTTELIVAGLALFSVAVWLAGSTVVFIVSAVIAIVVLALRLMGIRFRLRVDPADFEP
jgi:hypothetical protein